MDLRRLAGVLLALIVYAVVRSAGCKVSVTTKDGVAKITRGDPGSLRLMDRIGMDFRNGSVLPVLEQFGYSGEEGVDPLPLFFCQVFSSRGKCGI